MAETHGPDDGLREADDRLATDVLNRFVHLVLFGRRGNGTWTDGSVLERFHISLTAGKDVDALVRINDEADYWSVPRAVRDLDEGENLSPVDLVVARMPAPAEPAQRYIAGALVRDRWQIDVRLNHPHPRRAEHLAAAVEFAEAAATALGRGALRAFHTNAFHAAEHLAQAELLSYVPAAGLIADAKTHRSIRGTYQLWARLDNTEPRFAKLLQDLDDGRAARTYLRGAGDQNELAVAREQYAVLEAMVEWVRWDCRARRRTENYPSRGHRTDRCRSTARCRRRVTPADEVDLDRGGVPLRGNAREQDRPCYLGSGGRGREEPWRCRAYRVPRTAAPTRSDRRLAS